MFDPASFLILILLSWVMSHLLRLFLLKCMLALWLVLALSIQPAVRMGSGVLTGPEARYLR